MLIHTVLLDVADQASVDEAMGILSDLSGRLAGLREFHHGPNRDYEAKSQRYSYGFVCTFDDRAALAAYDAHFDHLRAGGLLVGACTGGADGIFVSDLEV